LKEPYTLKSANQSRLCKKTFCILGIWNWVKLPILYNNCRHFEWFTC
jgi:hypothetical protein